MLLVGGVWTLLCALGGVRSLALVLGLVLVLYMRCHQVGTCYCDKIVTVTVAATRYVAVVVAVAAARALARPLH